MSKGTIIHDLNSIHDDISKCKLERRIYVRPANSRSRIFSSLLDVLGLLD